jgi:predicted CXXCH cytochrome family protein
MRAFSPRTLFLAVGVATLAFAAGPHDANCVDCHSLHAAKGKAILAVEPGLDANPFTGAAAASDVAFCLGCHGAKVGIAMVHLNTTHPVGMKPGRVKVPAELLRADGTVGCMSCHEPHPSNANYKYLRGSVTQANELGGKFCVLCHSEKTAPQVASAKS